jgi:hypothetical protein
LKHDFVFFGPFLDTFFLKFQKNWGLFADFHRRVKKVPIEKKTSKKKKGVRINTHKQKMGGGGRAWYGRDWYGRATGVGGS